MKEIGEQVIPVDQLKIADYNPTTISEENKVFLENSIKKFGMVELPVWNRTTGNIVAGNKRVQLLKDNGMTQIQVLVVEADPSEERFANVLMNSDKITGDFQRSKLEVVLKDVKEKDPEGYKDFGMFQLEAPEWESGEIYTPKGSGREFLRTFRIVVDDRENYEEIITKIREFVGKKWEKENVKLEL